MADAPDRVYPKQPLARAIERGLARPGDSPARQRVRMGDNPEARLREDYSLRVGGKQAPRYTLGDIEDRMAEDRAASRSRRRSRRSSR